MAPPRRTTGKAAPTKGAASAVSPADPNLTPAVEETVTVTEPTDALPVEDTPVTVDANRPPDDAELELLREAAAGDNAAQRAAHQLGVPANEGIPAGVSLPGHTLPKITEGVQGQVGAVEQPSAVDMGLRSTLPPQNTVPTTPPRDLTALRALADTSGLDPVTPYPADGIPAPNPLALLPEPRTTTTWVRETEDDVLTARVLADGWRVLINGNYQFAQRGDRVTAPTDIIRDAAKYGVVIIEE